jgi:hypothetical protein
MIQGTFSERADYTGEFEFTDPDGDVKSGSRIERLAESNESVLSSTGKIDLLYKPGPFTVWITLYETPATAAAR